MRGVIARAAAPVGKPRGEAAFVALDVEATGMDPSRHEILEVAVVVSSDEESLERFQSLVRPREHVSLDIVRLTGIERESLVNAPPFREVENRIRDLIDGLPIVAHSVDLDLAMLDAAGLSVSTHRIDTFQLATLLLPDLPNYSLASVAQRLGIEAGKGHRALGDAEVTAAVYRAMLKMLRALDAGTLDQLASLARAAEWPIAPLFARLAAETPWAPLFQPGVDGRKEPHELSFLTPRERPEPLKVTGSDVKMDVDRVERALSPDGMVSSAVVQYEDRPQQREMAIAVARAFNEDEHLLVEAGTGTGKSLAYLLPAVLHATERGETVVVSTNTLALQDQLYRKDIPSLREAMESCKDGDNFRVSLLKGRGNYLCLRRWFSGQKQPVMDAAESGLRAKVTLWLSETDTGDRSELRLDHAEDRHWQHISAEEHACVASRCVYQQRNQCFLFRARRNAENAHLVVVNHALLLSDTVAGSRVLPDYERLIVDEAHHLEDQATKHFGFSVDERMLLDVLDNVYRLDSSIAGGAAAQAVSFMLVRAQGGTAERRAEAAERRKAVIAEGVATARARIQHLFSRLDGLVDAGPARGGYGRTVRLTPDLRGDAEWSEIELAWDELDQALRTIESELRWLLDAVESAEPDAGTPPDDAVMQQFDDVSSALVSVIREGAALAANLNLAIASPPAEMVSWLERSPVQGRLAIHAAPLRVDGVLREQLFGRLRTAILTSATLTTDSSFDFVTGRLGMGDPRKLMVPSPFDYSQSTLLFVADDIPEPNHPRYQQELHTSVIEACAATRGRALVLFTSHAALQAAYRAIKRPLEDRGIVVLGQRTDGNPRQLIERLRHSPDTVVLGTASFWEGIDVVGQALSLLVITKLPFSVPSDPVFAARGELIEEEGGHAFGDYAVPTAVLKFKQGFGRLIRSSEDRGVCAVLDRRVISKRYGRSFVESLPDCALTVGSLEDLPDAASEWLQSKI
jgi:Rad3-related DNA helicase/DNA polymerase III epsilon subunit-like protein